MRPIICSISTVGTLLALARGKIPPRMAFTALMGPCSLICRFSVSYHWLARYSKRSTAKPSLRPVRQDSARKLHSHPAPGRNDRLGIHELAVLMIHAPQRLLVNFAAVRPATVAHDQIVIVAKEGLAGG